MQGITLTQEELDKVLSQMSPHKISERAKIQEEVRKKFSAVIEQVRTDKPSSSGVAPILQEEVDRLFNK